jgi:hypothetical protein
VFSTHLSNLLLTAGVTIAAFLLGRYVLPSSRQVVERKTPYIQAVIERAEDRGYDQSRDYERHRRLRFFDQHPWCEACISYHAEDGRHPDLSIAEEAEIAPDTSQVPGVAVVEYLDGHTKEIPLPVVYSELATPSSEPLEPLPTEAEDEEIYPIERNADGELEFRPPAPRSLPEVLQAQADSEPALVDQVTALLNNHPTPGETTLTIREAQIREVRLARTHKSPSANQCAEADRCLLDPSCPLHPECSKTTLEERASRPSGWYQSALASFEHELLRARTDNAEWALGRQQRIDALAEEFYANAPRELVAA